MPRNYGRTATSIWRDKDFRDLTPEARFTYTMLYNQPNISAVGVLEVTWQRWAGNTGYDVKVVERAVAELVERGYVVTDSASEELFVRSFVKWDGGSNNDLRRKAIKAAADAVASDEIRASIAIELDRIEVPHGLPKPYRSPLDTHRVVVKVVDHVLDPQPATFGGEPEPLDASAEPPEESEYCAKHPNGTDKNCGACGTARRRAIACRADRAATEARARAATAAATKACDQCDDLGWRLSDDNRPTRRCDHREQATA